MNRSLPFFAAAALAACSSSPSGGENYTGTTANCGPYGGKLIAVNQGDDTMSIIDPATGNLLCPVLVPIMEEQNMEMPHEISTDPSGRFFIVNLMEMPANSTARSAEDEISMMNSPLRGYVLKLSPADGTLQASAQVDPDPGDNTLSPDGSMVYVSCFDEPTVAQVEAAGDTNPRHMDGNLWAIDSAEMAVVTKLPICPEPHVLEVSPDGQWLFSSCYNDEVAMIDISDPRGPKLAARISEDEGGPDGGQVEVLPSNASLWPMALQTSFLDTNGHFTVWVSNWNPQAYSLGIVDPLARAFVNRIPMTSKPMFTTFSTDGKTAYTAHQQPDGIAIFDVAAQAQTGDIPLPAATTTCVNAHQIILSSDGRTGWVLCEGDHQGSGQFLILDLPTQKVLSHTQVGMFPMEMDLMPTPSGG